MKKLLTIIFLSLTTSVFAQNIIITEFGAKNDSQPDTEAIQKAIDACSKNGGGTVVFPAGTWISGTIYLKDNISIYLSMGATWQGENNNDAYPFIAPVVNSREDKAPRRTMIYAYQKKNIKIFGEGTIYPGGDYDIFHVTKENDKEMYYSRPFGLLMIECQDINIEGIKLTNSAFWMQRYFHCDNLKFNNFTVFNHSNLNNDGIDIDGCKDVIISNCVIDSSDDAIVLKSEGERKCENVTITNCILSSHATPLKCGTSSVGGYKNITMNNIVIKPSKSLEMHHLLEVWGGLSGIDLLCVDGGSMENIAIDNITMDGVETPLFIKLGNRNSAWKGKTKFDIGTIKNIRINNVTAINSGKITSSITGYKGHYVENVTLSNIRFESLAYKGKTEVKLQINERSGDYPYNHMFGLDYPVYGFYVNYGKNITLNNVEFVKHKSDSRPGLQFENTKNSRLLNVRTSEKEYVKQDIETDSILILN
ncbi:glycoside hydrolase family 28 protein [Lutibacter citreus]|uniref:glycoside hydrolase family 28 protein n=1 Tax=Lutibacter citreus TaxID=2138210 RepID=UPI000DBE130E|nr:glycosyl hydrolase family 28 protein [Lutibacter citreus]